MSRTAITPKIKKEWFPDIRVKLACYHVNKIRVTIGEVLYQSWVTSILTYSCCIDVLKSTESIENPTLEKNVIALII